jgi:succinate dehydrogenase/fumarate reductase flavoprotein subunit
MIARAALERKESRGAHFREDFPAKSEIEGQSNIVVRQTDTGEMQVTRTPLKPVPAELQQIIEEMK